MFANPGDWLIIKGRAVGHTVRRGLIEEVHGADGAPPYFVHWTDSGTRALVFPGPDAYILTPEELRTRDEVTAARFSAVRHHLSSHAAVSGRG